MTWAAIFERGARADVDLAAIQAALATRRGREDGPDG